MVVRVCFFKQKTAYEMRISDWSSDVCSSDLMSQQDLIFSHLQHRHAAAFQNRLLSLKCKAVLCRDLARPDGVLADDEPIALPLGRFIEIGRSADRFVLRDGPIGRQPPT